MKSGIRSMGLKAYAVSTKAKARAYHCVCGCFIANQSVMTSRFNAFAHDLKLLICTSTQPYSMVDLFQNACVINTVHQKVANSNSMDFDGRMNNFIVNR